MPEEINRVLTDQVSDALFIHSPEAEDNLRREGCAPERIHFVGNTMIDTLVAMRDRIAAAGAPARHGLAAGDYIVVTLHRPALVDTPLLADAIAALGEVAREIPVVFPAHPRTRAAAQALGIHAAAGVVFLDPVGYVEFMSLVAGAAGVLTDSGGIQEETTFLGIPCFTLRDNTERPVTVTEGTNTLLGLDPARIADVPGLLSGARGRRHTVPAGWDGHAARRVVDVLTPGGLAADERYLYPAPEF
jgi:UDP-N-acetylglucosamine 2-epimerase (non-hydrolysing)